MTGYLLTLTSAPRQVCTVNVVINGESFHAQVEIRYLPAPDRWFLTLWDHASGERLVNLIPLVCSYGGKNDLFLPFRHLRDGKGLGSLLCLRATDTPSTPDPARSSLTDFQLLWSDDL